MNRRSACRVSRNNHFAVCLHIAVGCTSLAGIGHGQVCRSPLPALTAQAGNKFISEVLVGDIFAAEGKGIEDLLHYKIAGHNLFSEAIAARKQIAELVPAVRTCLRSYGAAGIGE